MSDKFSYHISTEQVPQLSSGERFAAKVTKLVRNPGPNHKLVPLSPNNVGHEFWGKTEGEAYAKAEAEVKAWIAAQNK